MKLRKRILHIQNTRQNLNYDLNQFVASLKDEGKFPIIKSATRTVLIGEEEHFWVCQDDLQHRILGAVIHEYHGYCPAYMKGYLENVILRSNNV